MRLGGAVVILIIALVLLGYMGRSSIDHIQLIREQALLIDGYKQRITELETEIKLLKEENARFSGANDALKQENEQNSTIAKSLTRRLQSCQLQVSRANRQVFLQNEIRGLIGSVSVLLTGQLASDNPSLSQEVDEANVLWTIVYGLSVLAAGMLFWLVIMLRKGG